MISVPPTRIAIFGSAFNPPHVGHADAIAQILDDYNQVFLVPSAAHALGKKMMAFHLRCHMLELLLEEFFPCEPKLTVDRIEEFLLSRNPGRPIYTFDLLNYYRETLPAQTEIHFVIGPDNALRENWEKFYRYREIERDFPLHVVAENIPVRSQKIRQIYLSLPESMARFELLTPLCGKAVAHQLNRIDLNTTEITLPKQ